MQETAINWDNEDKEVIVSTSETNIKDKLDKLCNEFPEHYKLKSISGDYKNYIIMSKKLIRFCKPVIISDEKRKELSEKMKKLVQEQRKAKV